MWSDVNNSGNPCPVGYRVPTKKEAETLVNAVGGIGMLSNSILRLYSTWTNEIASITYRSNMNVNNPLINKIEVYNIAGTKIDINRHIMAIRCIKD